MKVLVADDDFASRKLLESALSKWGYQVIPVADGDAALAALSGDEAPRLAILDWEMPGKSGVEICLELRARSDGDYVYVLLLTGRTAKEDALSGLDSGADDYLTKPVDPRELKCRLRSGRRIVELQQALREALQTVQHAASHDALTGAPNRAHLLSRLAHEHERSRVDGTRFSVFLLDVDHFKRVNDEHGHGAGDDVLREIAERCRGLVRLHDKFGRYGGEEFLCLLPGAGGHEAVQVAERVRNAIAGAKIRTRAGELSISASIGVATLRPGDTTESLVERADVALYRAKNTGRNKTVSAEEGRPTNVPPRPSLVPGGFRDRVLERLVELLGEPDQEEFDSLSRDFVTSAERDLAAIRAATDGGDLHGLRRRAHALKGASLNFGLDAVAKIAASLEAAEAPSPKDVDALERIVQRVARELLGEDLVVLSVA